MSQNDFRSSNLQDFCQISKFSAKYLHTIGRSSKKWEKTSAKYLHTTVPKIISIVQILTILGSINEAKHDGMEIFGRFFFSQNRICQISPYRRDYFILDLEKRGFVCQLSPYRRDYISLAVRNQSIRFPTRSVSPLSSSSLRLGN